MIKAKKDTSYFWVWWSCDQLILSGLNYGPATILMQVIYKSRTRDFHRAGFGGACVCMHVCLQLIRNPSFTSTNFMENMFYLNIYTNKRTIPYTIL